MITFVSTFSWSLSFNIVFVMIRITLSTTFSWSPSSWSSCYKSHILGWEHLGAKQRKYPWKERDEGFRFRLADQDWTGCLLPVGRGDFDIFLNVIWLFNHIQKRGNLYPFPTFDSGLKGSNGRAMKVLTVVFFHLFGISNFDCSKGFLTRHISKALQ